MANYHLAWNLSWDCDFDRGLAHFEKCVRMSAEIMDPIGLSWAKGTMSTMNLALQGLVDQAFTISNEALLISEGSDDIFSQINTFTSQGYSYYLKGFFEEAETHLRMGEGMCERFNQVSWWAWTLGFLGDLYSDMGSHEKAQEYYRKAIEIMRRAQLIPSWVNTWEISIAKQRVLTRMKEVNHERLIECYEANNFRICDGRNARHLGEIFLNSGEHFLDSAEDWIERAIKADKSNGARWQLARDYALHADLLKKKGDVSAAAASMKSAIAIYEECGADGWVKKSKKALEMHQ
jgi:tetratricopeptide (TPR) repeat protein